MAKNDPFHEGRKVERSKATPFKLFSVDSYDLKSMSFKFGNDIFITLEMLYWKINISLLLRPFVSEVLVLLQRVLFNYMILFLRQKM